MDRVYESGASASPPSPPAAPSTGYPTPGAPGVAAATLPGPWWHHMMTEEMRAVIVAGGLTPDHTNLAQLLAAISALGVAALGASLVAANGYVYIPCKDSGGNKTSALLQWGAASSNASGDITVTLPTAFATTSYAVVSGANATDVSSYSVNRSSHTTTQIVFKTSRGGVANPLSFYWAAIGVAP